MGSNHFRVAIRNPEVELTAVCDNDLTRLDSLSLPSDVIFVTDPSQLIGLVDGVVIATGGFMVWECSCRRRPRRRQERCWELYQR